MSFNKHHEHLKHGPYTLSTYKDRTPKRTWVYFYFFFFPLVTEIQHPKVPNTPSCQRTMTSLEANQNPHQTDAYPPATLNVQSQSGGPWSTGLCDCCDDVGICCLTWLCPCITFGRVAEIVDRGSVSCGANCAIYTLIAMVTGCPCIYSCCYRSRIRGQYLLQEDPCHDCLVHWCCETCALCQEYRELKNRGFDMSLGWDGNVARQTHGVTTLPPAVNGGMSR